MKKLNVIVKEKTILELSEDGKKGDLIDLKEIVEVDTSYLDQIIESGKDKVYLAKLEDVKNALKLENEIEINKLQSTIEKLTKENESNLKLKELEIEKKYNNHISELTKKVELLESTKEAEIESINNKNQLEMNKQIAILDAKYANLETKYNMDIASKDSEIEKIKLNFDSEKAKVLLEQKAKYDEELKAKEDIINNLQRAKASMNVKQTGEDLETWCDNEVLSYMQNGLLNCRWIKDNKVVKEEDEAKGSKADYIFKVYASEKHEDNELLTSICLDMKDENPDSINKKTNADYYKALDKNREKKACKYAVLVSNLEMDKPNTLPIFKVREYENMYVVRPAYLMVFLNMIASLTTRFADLVLSKEVEMIELKTKLDLIDEFEDIKKTYLDKPLELLEKCIDSISKSSDSIKSACKSIDEQCDRANKSYISQIIDKIGRFELKLSKGIAKNLE